MKNKIIKILKIIKYGPKGDSKTYLKFLSKKGIIIGRNVNLYSPQTIRIDTTCPFLISIGDNVHITAGVTILNHGYDWIVASKKYGNVFGNIGRVKIGNNVFIGNNAIILKGANIGDDVIIGAGALVCGDCSKSGVYAGVPARYIMSIEEYRNRRTAKQNDEATEIVLAYYEKYGRVPTDSLRALRAYFWLWTPRNSKLNDIQAGINNRFDATWSKFYDTEPMYDSFDDFIKHVLGQD